MADPTPAGGSGRPTLHLTSAAQANAWKRKGPLPGPHLTIQIHPNVARGEAGQGYVQALRPTWDEWEVWGSSLIESRRRKKPADPEVLAAYRGSMERGWSLVDLSPGWLKAHMATGALVPVPDGAVLTCCCAADHARAGECHRAWAAPFLVAAGWRVVLDGVEVVDGR